MMVTTGRCHASRSSTVASEGVPQLWVTATCVPFFQSLFMSVPPYNERLASEGSPTVIQIPSDQCHRPSEIDDDYRGCAPDSELRRLLLELRDGASSDHRLCVTRALLVSHLAVLSLLFSVSVFLRLIATRRVRASPQPYFAIVEFG